MLLKIIFVVTSFLFYSNVSAETLNYRTNIIDAFTYQTADYTDNFTQYFFNQNNHLLFRTSPIKKPNYETNYQVSTESSYQEEIIDKMWSMAQVVKDAKTTTDEIYFFMIAQQKIWNLIPDNKPVSYLKNGDLILNYEKRFQSSLEKLMKTPFETSYDINETLQINVDWNWEDYDILSDTCETHQYEKGLQVTNCTQKKNIIQLKPKNNTTLFYTSNDAGNLIDFGKYQPTIIMNVIKQVEENENQPLPEKEESSEKHEIKNIPKTKETIISLEWISLPLLIGVCILWREN